MLGLGALGEFALGEGPTQADTTALPFNNTPVASKPRRLDFIVPDQFHADPSKFTNPIPFVSTDRPRVVPVRFNPPQAQPYNVEIYSGVPFFTTDRPRTVRGTFIRPPQPQPQPYNTLVYSEVPFNQSDYLKPFRTPNLPPVPATPFYNSLLYSGVPFFTTDRPRVMRSPFIVPQPLPLNQNLLSSAIGAPPFYQLDWSKPVTARRASAPQAEPYNIVFASGSLVLGVRRPLYLRRSGAKPSNYWKGRQ